MNRLKGSIKRCLRPLFRLLTRALRPLLERTRAYLNAPLAAQVDALRVQVQTLETRSGGGAESTRLLQESDRLILALLKAMPPSHPFGLRSAIADDVADERDETPVPRALCESCSAASRAAA